MAHLDSKMRACIDECNACHDTCVETLTHCLAKGGKHAEARHVRTLTDCAEICHISADFMLRGSTSHVALCDLCADVCDECAASCEALPGAEMKQCADQCRRCAAECRTMATAHA